jgi:hypothetical protein
MCGQATDDPTGTKKRIVDVRRTLFAKNPENFSKTGEISTADLGGDTFFSTPKKKGNFYFLFIQFQYFNQTFFIFRVQEAGYGIRQ